MEDIVPHSNGPKPKPSIFTLLAIVEALPFLSSAAKLTIVVVAVLVKVPLTVRKSLVQQVINLHW